MKVDTKEITDGNLDGQVFWVCDFRFNEYSEATKPLRHVKPTEVIVVCNESLPKNKTVYYSESHFLPLNKQGDPIKSKIIAPFDNTGYRALTGTPLNIFTDEAECKSHYKKQCDDIIELLKSRQVKANEFFNSEIKKIKILREI